MRAVWQFHARESRICLRVGAQNLVAHKPDHSGYRDDRTEVDQYHVNDDKRSGIRSDPNRADDPQYIVRLVGQVTRVSVETARLVSGLVAEVELPELVAVGVVAEG